MQKKNDNSVIFSFWKGITFPFECIYGKIKEFVFLSGVFSFISAFLIMIFGRSFACVLGLTGGGIYCLANIWGMLLLFLLLCFIMACFINRWWLIAYKNVTLVEAMRVKPEWRDIKIFGFLLVYLIAFSVVGGGFYLLYARTATPNVNLELAFFCCVSLVILAALVVLLDAVIFARFLDEKKWFLVRKTLWPIFDNIYKIVMWFLFYLLVFAYLVRQAGSLFFLCQKLFPLWISSFLGEFALQFVFYFMAVCAVSLLRLQEKYIFNED